MWALKLFLAGAFHLVFLSTTKAFYLPGLAPVSYCEKESNVVGKCKVSAVSTLMYLAGE